MNQGPPPASGSAACPPAEQLAAFADATLTGVERADVERHLAICGDCREAVGLAASLPGPGRTIAPAEAVHRSFLIPSAIVALAAAAVLIFAIVLPGRWAANDRRALLDAVSGTRTAEPRLTTMSRYVEAPAVMRDGTAAEVPADIRIAEAELQQWADETPSAANLHALGVARLAVRDPTGAVIAMEQALARRDLTDVRADLAAALLAEGYRHGDPVRVERARGMIAEVLARDPGHAAALFNAALAAEYLGDRDEAVAAWGRYLAHDSGSPWAAEARLRLERLAQR